MGANSPQGLVQRAMRGQAQSYGPPLAGKSLTVAFDATDKTVALDGSATYMLAATSACFIGLADTTAATNQELLPASWQRILSTPAAGLTLHVTQQSAAGTLKAAKLDDVE